MRKYVEHRSNIKYFVATFVGNSIIRELAINRGAWAATGNDINPIWDIIMKMDSEMMIGVVSDVPSGLAVQEDRS